MSAFMVGRKTMDAVVTSIVENTEVFHGVPVSNPSAIGRKLFRMNRKAVLARYGEMAKNTMKAPRNYVFTPRKDLSEGARWRALNCLLYQCSEGDVPDSKLFKELDGIASAITDRTGITWGTPGVENGIWGD